MAWFAAGLMLPMLAAYAFVVWCDRDASNDAATFFLRICLSIGIGAGLSSCTYFLWLFFVGTPGNIYHVCELAIFTSAGLFGLVLVRVTKTFVENPQSAPTTAAPWHRFLLTAFVAALVLAAFGALGFFWGEPLGGWDAWAIWSQRARFLFHSGDQWRQSFSPTVFAHCDYPLLVPSGNARLWSYLGAESRWVPWFFGSLLTFATVGALTAGIARLRSRTQGLLAGMVLLGMVPFLQQGASQYADVPLAFFILAAVLLLVLHDASERPHRELLVLSGLMAGLAAWTKNEGLLFLVALPIARGIVVWRRDCARGACNELLCWSAGVLPILAVIAIQKVCLGGGNDLIEGQGWEASWARILDPSRYGRILQAFVLYAFRIARPFAVVLPLCGLLLGAAKNRSRAAMGLSTACVVLLLVLAGYFVVYVTTPCELELHLATSADRLLMQVCPLSLLILFLWLAAPEELLTAERKGVEPALAPASKAVLPPHASIPARPH